MVILMPCKLLKPGFASLYELGYESSAYVEDNLLLAQTFQECFDKALSTISLLQELGFVVHPKKPIFIPTQKVTFLCFEIDTLNRSFIKRQTSGTTSDSEWTRVVQQMTTNDNEWQRVLQRVTTNDEWQRVVQRVTTSDKEWQRMTIGDNEWE